MIIVFLSKPTLSVEYEEAYFYKNLSELEKQVDNNDFCLDSGDSVWILEVDAKEVHEYSRVTTSTLKRIK